MIGYLRRHHVALLALFVALGGTSYAATQLPANSVGTRQLRASAVTEAKLSVGLRALLANRPVAGGVGPQGATGAIGPMGPIGPVGQAGPAGGSESPPRAWGYVVEPPLCPAGQQCPAFDPVAPILHNARFDPSDAGAPLGTVCIALGAGIDRSTAVLIAVPLGMSYWNSQQVPLAQAQWVPRGTPDCPSGDLVVRTSIVTGDSTGLHEAPAAASFQFVVP
jgi:hypothetical protein